MSIRSKPFGGRGRNNIREYLRSEEAKVHVLPRIITLRLQQPQEAKAVNKAE